MTSDDGATSDPTVLLPSQAIVSAFGDSVTRRILVIVGLSAAVVLSLARLQAQKPAQDQWPNYAHNSNYSPLTQITPGERKPLDQSIDVQLWGRPRDNVPLSVLITGFRYSRY